MTIPIDYELLGRSEINASVRRKTGVQRAFARLNQAIITENGKGCTLPYLHIMLHGYIEVQYQTAYVYTPDLTMRKHTHANKGLRVVNSPLICNGT